MSISPFSLQRKGDGMAISPFYLKGMGMELLESIGSKTRREYIEYRVTSPFSLKRKGDGMATSPFYLKGMRMKFIESIETVVYIDSIV